MRVFITFVKSIASIVRFIVAFFLFIFSKFVEMKIMRKHFEYEIIQKIFNNHKNFIISNLRDLSFNPLIETFAAFTLFMNHINKSNIFEFTIYE